MRGVSIVELVIALAIALLVSALAARALVEAADAFAWQPAAGELTARARAVAQAITADLTSAGAGPRVRTGAAGVVVGSDTARLTAWLPPILPRLVALGGGGDGDGTAHADRLSILTIADTAPQAAVRRWPPGWAFVPGPTCPALIDRCGLRLDMPLLLLEPRPGFHLTEAGALDDSGLELVAVAATGDDAVVAAVEVVSYRFDAGRGELLRGRAAGRGLPVADHVTAFDVELWGDADPPAGPRWPAGGNTCVTAADGAPRLPAWAPPGSPAVRLEVARLSDGPWCGVPPFRFDADLFRVRRVRVHVRFEAEPESARGRNPARVTRAGLATAASREVDDLDVVVEVTPPALRGGP